MPDTVFAEDQLCLGDGPERKVTAKEVATLRMRGHQVEYTDSRTATTQLVVVNRDNGTTVVHAVSDARKGGKPAAQSLKTPPTLR